MDADADGYYVSDSLSCAAPNADYTSIMGIMGDCNDDEASVNPSSMEICDTIDNDCDLIVDEGTLLYYYLDADNDNFGVATDSIGTCSFTPPAFYAVNTSDCDDNDININPGVSEICQNGIDEDCDGVDDICSGVQGCTDVTACNYNPQATVNDGSCINPLLWYLDADADGYYVSDSLACSAPTSDYSATAGILGDCNDAQAAINSAATEICDDLDNDCDEEIDEFVQNTYYLDNDADGFGDVNSIALACSPVAGYVSNSDDCDDALLLYLDADNDGFGGNVLAACGEINNTDCNDASSSVYPGATEFCENNIDENCDGSDEICVGIPGCTNPSACNFDPLAEADNGSCTYGVLWYLDADADGFAADTITSCTQPSPSYTSSVLVLGDCNDNDLTINISAAEICGNGIDENCDGSDEVCEVPGCTDVTACNFEPQATTDDGTCTYPIVWYYDADADGYASDSVSNCSAPGPDYYDSVLPLTDCNDNDNTINAAAVEICENGVDEDCDGQDNSCTVAGCTNVLACNFNPAANTDDGSCLIIGSSCDDGDATTGNDVVNANCECVGTPLTGCDLNPIVITLDSVLNVECYQAATGYISVSVTGGNAPFFASWNSFPIQTTPYASGLVAGVYTFTVEDEDGCVGTFSQEITEPAGSLPVVTGNNDVDPADNEQYIVNTTPGCTYTWSVSNGLIVSGQDNDTLNVIWNDADMGTIYVYQTDTATGCQWVDGLAVYINALGTQEISSRDGWILYPNPTTSIIHLDGLLLNAEITILDATGRIVDQMKANENTIKIDLSEFTNGLYLIQVKDEKGVRTERLMKQ